MNDGYDWIVDLDLERFFDTVNQDKLIGLIMKTVKDGEVVSLNQEISCKRSNGKRAL